MSSDNTDKTLTFNDTGSFNHWLKRQRKTTFSVPVVMEDSIFIFQYIEVSKRALSAFHITSNEQVEVTLSKAKYSDRYYAFIKPMRVRGDNK